MNRQSSNLFTPQSATRDVLSLHELNSRIAMKLSDPSLRNVWITAETSDLRVKGGHCYLELIEKDSEGKNITSRIRAIIWGNTYRNIAMKFSLATGVQLGSSQKVMVWGSVNYNSNFGMSFIINDIEPSYTIGDVEAKRRQILQRLANEGIIDMNRQISWPLPALRIAIISAEGAAGYGDFLHQLYSSPYKFRFTTSLFPALMQGERTPASIIAALERITDDIDNWDIVVIIRGGGATSDLVSFDDYDLAANIANFPIPVIVGIGHERDITVLDYVANRRVKTPTAAAELIISEAEKNWDALQNLASDILRIVSDRITGCRTQLAYISGLLPVAPGALLGKSLNRLASYSLSLSGAIDRKIAPLRRRIDIAGASLAQATSNIINRKANQLSHWENLLEALSPKATLARGYSITRVNGKAIVSPEEIMPDTIIETTLAEGTIISKTI